MKKLLFVVVICLAFMIESQAQVSFKPGLRGGANFSKITQTGSTFKTDFYIGAYGALSLGRFYTLQPEIGYSNQGGGNMFLYDDDYYYYGGEGTLTKRSLTISYVSISLINKFNFTDKVNFHLGPVIDIESGRTIYTSSPVDIGFTAGIGYKITNNLALEGRIKKGFIVVYDSHYLQSNSPNTSSYNTNFLFQLGLSYTFDIQN